MNSKLQSTSNVVCFARVAPPVSGRVTKFGLVFTEGTEVVLSVAGLRNPLASMIEVKYVADALGVRVLFGLVKSTATRPNFSV